MFNVKKMFRYITNINDHKSHLFYVNGYNIIVKASPHYADGCQGPLLTILHTSTYEQTFSWENKFATNIILSRGIPNVAFGLPNVVVWTHLYWRDRLVEGIWRYLNTFLITEISCE
jgi:hypothetical protein